MNANSNVGGQGPWCGCPNQEPGVLILNQGETYNHYKWNEYKIIKIKQTNYIYQKDQQRPYKQGETRSWIGVYCTPESKASPVLIILNIKYKRKKDR